MKRNTILISLVTVFVFGVAGFFSFNVLWRNYKEKKQLQQRRAAWSVLEEKIRLDNRNFGQETGIIIKDLSTGWKITINEDKLFPSASVVKVPIMASLFSISAEGRLDLKQNLALKNSCKVLGSGRLKEYSAGSEFTIEDLIEFMVEDSDNTAANMLIDYFGFDLFNSYFKKMGLHNTNIARKMMDFKKRKEGLENFTSAGDLAYLLEEIYYNRLINRTFAQRCLDILKKQKINDRIPARLPVNTVIAHKTGLERGVCHDAGIVFTPKGNFVVCVLTKHNYKFAKPAKKFISQVASDVYNYYQPGSS